MKSPATAPPWWTDEAKFRLAKKEFNSAQEKIQAFVDSIVPPPPPSPPKAQQSTLDSEK